MSQHEIRIPKRELSEAFRREFIQKLQGGKEYILYGGLLLLAHDRGFKSIQVKLLQAPSEANGHTAICEAQVVDDKGQVWTEIGDANDKNCSSRVAPHKIRMAATRAKARALRDALGIDLVVDVELETAQAEPMSPEQARAIRQLMKEKGLTKEDVRKITERLFGISSASEMSHDQANILISELELLENPSEADEEEVEEAI